MSIEGKITFLPNNEFKLGQNNFTRIFFISLLLHLVYLVRASKSKANPKIEVFVKEIIYELRPIYVFVMESRSSLSPKERKAIIKLWHPYAGLT